MADELSELLGSKMVIRDQKTKPIGYVYDIEMSRHDCQHEAHPESVSE